MQQQATGRMAGQTGPSIFHAVGAFLVATALVVGLSLASQRLSTDGPVVAPAPAEDLAAGIYGPGRSTLNQLDVSGPEYIWDETIHTYVPNKATRGLTWDLKHHRYIQTAPQAVPGTPNGLRKGSYEIR
jgi:hypothetical protein